MESNEKQMIDELFTKLKQAEDQSGSRDASAEAAIQQAVAQQPAAPYYMAQAIMVQEHALNNLNQRVEELEQALKERPAGGGSFLGGLFGAGNAAPAKPKQAARGANPSPFRNAPQGSFLGSAMQTAVGVAGGMLLANAAMGMFAGDEAQVDTGNEETMPPDEGADFSEESGGDFDTDFGGFDDF